MLLTKKLHIVYNDKKSEQKCVSVTYLLCIKIKEQYITPFSYLKYSSLTFIILILSLDLILVFQKESIKFVQSYSRYCL